LLGTASLAADPGPGDIYREYTHIPPSGVERVTDPLAWAPLRNPGNPVRSFVIGDLEGAVRAEVYI